MIFSLPMKRLLSILVILIIPTFSCVDGRYIVLKVTDTDTIDILYGWKKERIRMLCVDTPESAHPIRQQLTSFMPIIYRMPLKIVSGQ